MLPPSWLLGLLDEGVGAESEGNPPVPTWALGVQSYPPGQQNHKTIRQTTFGSSRRRKWSVGYCCVCNTQQCIALNSTGWRATAGFIIYKPSTAFCGYWFCCGSTGGISGCWGTGALAKPTGGLRRWTREMRPLNRTTLLGGRKPLAPHSSSSLPPTQPSRGCWQTPPSLGQSMDGTSLSSLEGQA